MITGEIFIVVLLILINGILSMAEMAIISSRKHKLRQLSSKGSKGARVALELSDNPNKFLSTIQIGITLVGILTGAFGGVTIAQAFETQLAAISFINPYHEAVALGIVVLVITYLTLIIGEIVPKRIALANPEGISTLVATPMLFLARVTAPIVQVLSLSTDGVLRILKIQQREDHQVSEEEIRSLVTEGEKAGVLEKSEKDILERTLGLGDKKVISLMTSRKEIVWLNIDSPFKQIRNKIAKNPHPYFPVCKETLDKIQGVIRTEDLLTDYITEEKIDLKKLLHKPLYVPTNMDALNVLELFKRSGIHQAMVVDEYGNIEGLISLTDILEAIVGDLPAVDELEDDEFKKRDDTSWFIDGLASIEDFKEHFKIKKMPGEKTGGFNTIGGFVVYKINKIPGTGDKFEWDNFIFEVLDMDGNRVDKILMTLKKL